MQEQLIKSHNLILRDRHSISLTGIIEVEKFDSTETCLYTELGELQIRGKNLNISSVSVETGDLEMSGEILSIVYSSGRERAPSNFITKLFK